MFTLEDVRCIVQQCENQNALTTAEVVRFAEAYRMAYKARMDASYWGFTSFIHDLGRLIDPRNVYGWHTVPVTFANGASGLDPALIGRAMINLGESWANLTLTPYDYYKEFEDIHPFIDGNGRVGDLI